MVTVRARTVDEVWWKASVHVKTATLPSLTTHGNTKNKVGRLAR